MSTIITKDNFLEQKYDVFLKFNKQLAVVAAGNIENFNAMTIGWGMMGNVWGHPGSAVTIYVSPDRYTYEYLEANEFFTVSFFPEAFREDLMTLGNNSGRNCDKIAMTSLTPRKLDLGVGFEEAELTFVCRKIYSNQFVKEKVPADVAKVYQRISPHQEYIGYIEDAFGVI